MFKTEFVDNFSDFYSEHKHHIEKHYKDFLETFNGTKELNVDVDLFQKLIDLNACNIFVIKDSESFVGYVSVTISPSPLFKGEVFCIVDHFYIVEEFRGKGFANKVLKEIEKQLKEDGVTSNSIALPEGKGHEAFAGKAGYTKQSSIYCKELGDN